MEEPQSAGAPVSEERRAALIAEVGGDRIVPAEVLHIARAADGRVVWLDRVGLATLLRPERIAEFAAAGVVPAELPGLPVRALVEGRGDVVVTVEPDGRIVDARVRGATDG